MIICFKLGKSGWFCVTKGKICLFVFCFCWRANFLWSKFASESVFLCVCVCVCVCKTLWVSFLLEVFLEGSDPFFKGRV